jgi:hypothetical protein
MFVCSLFFQTDGRTYFKLRLCQCLFAAEHTQQLT